MVDVVDHFVGAVQTPLSFLPLLLVNGLQALYSSYLTQMLFTVEMKGKREGGCHLMLFVFAHGPLIVEARWVTVAKAR
jgi:hypothetical protein